MVTWHPPSKQKERQTRLKTLPSCNFFGGPQQSQVGCRYNIRSSGRVGGAKKHEIYVAAFGGHLFYDFFVHRWGAMAPSAPGSATEVDAHFLVRDFIRVQYTRVAIENILAAMSTREKSEILLNKSTWLCPWLPDTTESAENISCLRGKVFLYVTFAMMETVTLERNQCSLSDYNSIRYAPYVHLWHRITLTLL